MVRLGCLVVKKTHAYFLDNSVTYSTCTCRVRIINYPVPISSPPFKIPDNFPSEVPREDEDKKQVTKRYDLVCSVNEYSWS